MQAKPLLMFDFNSMKNMSSLSCRSGDSQKFQLIPSPAMQIHLRLCEYFPKPLEIKLRLLIEKKVNFFVCT